MHQEFKLVLVVSHQLISYFFLDRFANEHGRLFEVGEQEDEYVLFVPGDLHQVDYIADFVEVSVEHMASRLNPELVVPDVQGRGPLLRNQRDRSLRR